MTEFPVPLDNLIVFVKALHPDGGPLENVTDAFEVSTRLGEQADALIGYFVDQARKSGATWSQIGGAMGVSKQAAQKRFVPGRPADVFPAGTTNFSRFTPRAAQVLVAAGGLAGDGHSMSAAHLAAALFAEPEGLAAKAITAAGLTPEQVYAAFGTGPAVHQDQGVDPAMLLDLDLDASSKDVLRGALKAALRLGHNYIGTEHLLLGMLFAGGQAAEIFGGLGLSPQRAEQLVAAQIAEFTAGRKPG